jgi:hypothetical protein
MKKAGYDLVHFGHHDSIFVNRAYRDAYDFLTPYDEFDCYHRAFISSNGFPIVKTRKWFYQDDKESAFADIFQFLVDYSMRESVSNKTEAGIAFPFHLSY